MWGSEHEVVAVENNPNIAKIYQDFFPSDIVVVADAHQYLLEHFGEFDFIWSSPPCPTHSRLRKQLSVTVGGAKPVYPDMKLYEEILFLQGYFKGKWVVENVMSWYDPLIKPQIIQRHYFWSNFPITEKEFKKDQIRITGKTNTKTQAEEIARLEQNHGFSLAGYSGDKRTMLQNCVSPEVGAHLLSCIS